MMPGSISNRLFWYESEGYECYDANTTVSCVNLCTTMCFVHEPEIWIKDMKENKIVKDL